MNKEDFKDILKNKKGAPFYFLVPVFLDII